MPAEAPCSWTATGGCALASSWVVAWRVQEAWFDVWLWLLFACKPFSPAPELPDTTDTVTTTGDTALSTPGSTGDTGPIVTEPFDFGLDPVTDMNNGRFATSTVCADCHRATEQSTAMRDISGRPVGAYDGWQATMMANASWIIGIAI